MIDSIIWSVFVLLVLVGTVAICYMIMLKLLLTKIDKPYYIIIPCDENSVNVRKIAYGMKIRMNFINDDTYGKIMVLDKGINNKEKEELLQICKDCNGIYCVDTKEIKDFFDGRI